MNQPVTRFNKKNSLSLIENERIQLDSQTVESNQCITRLNFVASHLRFVYSFILIRAYFTLFFP
jgi:hypothetical protein